MQRFRPGGMIGEPEKVPRKQPGDGWIILGLFAGAGVGAILGWVVADAADFNPFAGVVVGLLAGAVLGVLIGDLAKKRLVRRA